VHLREFGGSLVDRAPALADVTLPLLAFVTPCVLLLRLQRRSGGVRRIPPGDCLFSSTGDFTLAATGQKKNKIKASTDSASVENSILTPGIDASFIQRWRRSVGSKNSVTP